ncbi:DUF3667 domain-containing protein [Sphingobacteriales bacterium UPWRP_1]|nr:hypothetical protein B6N25_10920 [Sphingobacteriales bacterium TSM_CSS]PSJ75651.1 DUF3667 domain-containing protein [Sphingobacteriales bacterium UPWRP_1]
MAANNTRKSKTCFNCNYEFAEGQPDEYCPRCGQENSQQIVSVGRFLSDLANNYVAIDSKLFRTLKGLFWPGWLTNEYSRGKIASYMLPVRIYFLISIIYFAIFSAKLNTAVNLEKGHLNIPAMDSLVVDETGQVINLQDSLKKAAGNNFVLPTDTAIVFIKNQPVSWKRVKYFVDKYDTEQALDSLKADNSIFQNPIVARIARQSIKIIKGNADDYLQYCVGSLPITMLLMMPLLALVFKLLYIRRKRYFIEHLTFFLHYHTFAYIILAVYMLTWGHNISGLAPFVVITLLIYLILAMKRVYGQNWFKTLFKSFLFVIFCYPIFLVMFALGTLAVSFFMF